MRYESLGHQLLVLMGLVLAGLLIVIMLPISICHVIFTEWRYAARIRRAKENG